MKEKAEVHCIVVNAILPKQSSITESTNFFLS